MADRDFNYNQSSSAVSAAHKMFSPSIKWKKVVNTAGPTPKPRHGHRAVSIKDLMIVYGGGNEGIVDDLHVYNTATNQWFVPAVRGDVPRGCAAFGMVCDNLRIYVFGGMVEFGKYSNDLFELQAKRWEWRQLRPRPPVTGHPAPCPRLGHSFTITNDQICYVFGGLAHERHDVKSPGSPIYLNDLYAIDLKVPHANLQWEFVVAQGPSPSPRESHSAVFFESSGRRELIIYGGMSGVRLGDVWILDLFSMTWVNPVIHGIPPLPRSLHTANIIANKMYIFGGWVPMEGNGEEKEWRCSNSLAVFNLDTFTWEQHYEDVTENSETVPRARAGHSSVVINKRVYIWSGRDGYRKPLSSQVYCKDMFYLETDCPSVPGPIQLVRATVRGLELSWQGTPTAESYLLQVQKCESDSSESSPGARPAARLSGGAPHVRMVPQRNGNAMPQQVMKVVRTNNNVAPSMSASPSPAMVPQVTPHRQTQQVVRVVQQGGRVAIQPAADQSGGQRVFANQKMLDVPPMESFQQSPASAHGQSQSHHVGEGIMPPNDPQTMTPKVVFVQSSQSASQVYGQPQPSSQAPAQEPQSSYIYTQQPTQASILYQQDQQGHGQFGMTNPTAVPSQMEFSSMPPSALPAEPKTTYTIPSVSNIDQAMPHNILDEALNDAENYEGQPESPNVNTTDNIGQNSQANDQQSEMRKDHGPMAQDSAITSELSECEPGTLPPDDPSNSNPSTSDQTCSTTAVQRSISEAQQQQQNTAGNFVNEGSSEVTSNESKTKIVSSEGQQQSAEVKHENVDDVEVKVEDPSVCLQNVDSKPINVVDGDVKKKEEIEEPKPENSIVESHDAGADSVSVPTSTQQLPQEQSTSAEETTIPSQQSSSQLPDSNVGLHDENNGHVRGEREVCSIYSTASIEEGQQPTSMQSADQMPVHPSLPNTQFISQAQSAPATTQNIWYDVGVFKLTGCVVSHFVIPYSEQNEIHEQIDPLADAHSDQKVELEPGTYYRFRVAGINACGRGLFSAVANFKTCIPGFPGAPSSIKISKGAEGAQLSWEPPVNMNGRIVEYSVYLAVRNFNHESQLSFVRVYVGLESRCIVPHHNLQIAHVDSSPKPAIIFRIAAKNEKGYGPATQVRWLQDSRTANAGSGGTPHRSNIPLHNRSAPPAIVHHRQASVYPGSEVREVSGYHPPPPAQPHLQRRSVNEMGYERPVSMGYDRPIPGGQRQYISNAGPQHQPRIISGSSRTIPSTVGNNPMMHSQHHVQQQHHIPPQHMQHGGPPQTYHQQQQVHQLNVGASQHYQSHQQPHLHAAGGNVGTGPAMVINDGSGHTSRHHSHSPSPHLLQQTQQPMHSQTPPQVAMGANIGEVAIMGNEDGDGSDPPTQSQHYMAKRMRLE